MLSTEIPEVVDTAVATTSTKKKRNRPKKKNKSVVGTSGEAGSKNIPVVKIPLSKTEASTNWKLLLSLKSSSISERKNNPRPPRPQSFHARKDQFSKPQMNPQETSSLTKSEDSKNPSGEGSSRSTGHDGHYYTKKPYHDDTPPLPPVTGLNTLGSFDYTHYGHLKTNVLPEHNYMTLTTPAVAIDCEMVGVGAMKEDALARVSVVNEFGYCLYDKFVKPKAQVTDYRTEFSGVREEDLKKAEDFKVVLTEIAELIKGHSLVGHSLKNDLDVLFLKHPKAKIRDTAMYYKKRFKKPRTPSLKGLVKDYLNVNIQKGEHSSITDAQATMKLYLYCREEWEDSISQKYNLRPHKYWLARDYRKAVQALGGNMTFKKK